MKQDIQIEFDEEQPKTLPAECFRSNKFFELEKRAIFSKKWILSCHKLRFQKSGDYLALEYAGFPYLVTLTKNGEYKAYHNVCRHRGFPIVQKDQGNASTFTCRYHAWTYRQDGSLARAPKFENEVDFVKDDYGLFPVHLHVTDKGFIFINLSAAEPEPFESYFKDLEVEWEHLPADEYEYAYSWTKPGNYNWKTFEDGYQECAHCQIAHPGFAKALNLETYTVTPFTTFARHTAELSDKKTVVSEDNPPTFTFCFPSCGVTTTDTMFYMMRVCPIDATHVRMEYDVFKRTSVSTEELAAFMPFYEQVEQEDYDLCTATQRGLNAGVYSAGRLHSTRENGVVAYQQQTLKFCLDHFNEEKAAGCEIRPAVPASQQETCAASSLCKALDDGISEMAW